MSSRCVIATGDTDWTCQDDLEQLRQALSHRTAHLSSDQIETLNEVMVAWSDPTPTRHICRSQIGWLNLLQINVDDVRSICTQLSSSTKSVLMEDLVRLIQWLQTSAIKEHQEKTKMDKDNFRVEHILRRTIGGLQTTKTQLDREVLASQGELATLRAQIEQHREESDRLCRKLSAVKAHVEAAMTGVMQHEHRRLRSSSARRTARR